MITSSSVVLSPDSHNLDEDEEEKNIKFDIISDEKDMEKDQELYR
jgi:hypothetical protein